MDFEYKGPEQGVFVWSGNLFSKNNLDSAKEAYDCVRTSVNLVMLDEVEMQKMWFCLIHRVHRADIYFKRIPIQEERGKIAKIIELQGYRVEVRSE